MREHSLAKVPVILAVGKREIEDRTVNIRRLGSRDQNTIGLEEVIANLVAEATPPDILRK